MISKELFSYSKDMLKRGEPVDSVKKLVGDMGRWTPEDVDTAIKAIIADVEEAKTQGRDPKTPLELMEQIETAPTSSQEETLAQEVNEADGGSDEVQPQKRSGKFNLIMLGVILIIIVIAIFVMKGSMDNSESEAEQAAIRSIMFSALPESTLYYDTHVGGYNPDKVESNDCSAPLFGYGSMVALVRDIEKISQSPTVCKIAIDGESWAMSTVLKDTELSYCWEVHANTTDDGTFHVTSTAKGGGIEDAYCE